MNRQIADAEPVRRVPPIRRVLHRSAVVLGLPAALFAGLWFASANNGHFLFPPLPRVLETFVPTWFTGSRLSEDVLPSLARFGLGFGCALLLGVALGMAIGSVRSLRSICEPVLEFARAIPPPALIPIVVLFAGIDNLMKVIVIMLGCLWPVLLNTVEGVRAVDDVLADTCRSYRIGGRHRIVHLVLRSASPQIVTGARQALAIGLILMVISEIHTASSGLGFNIRQFQRSFEYPQMWSGVILLGLIGVGLSLLFGVVERRVLRWYHGVRAVARER